MKRPAFIARQSGNPSGVLGRLIAWVMARETAPLNARAVELLELAREDSVLEIGFGHGRTVRRIAAQVPHGYVAGIDVSASMTQLARARNRELVTAGLIDLQTGDCDCLPFEDAAFDKVLSVHTLYFWQDPVTCLRQIERVLRPGGRLVLGFTRKSSRHAGSFPHDVYRFYDEDRVEAMLGSASLSLQDMHGLGEAVLMLASK